MGQRAGMEGSGMIASLRWSVGIGWLLLFGALVRITGIIPKLEHADRLGRLLTLISVMSLIVVPIWIQFCAHQLGYIRGATNDLSPPEQRIVEDYKRKVEAKQRDLSKKVNRWAG
jgi:hypothetical protein